MKKASAWSLGRSRQENECWQRHRHEAVTVTVVSMVCLSLEAQACRYTAVSSKGGQMSKLPSALGTNLPKVSEMKESCEVYAVPK